jgi:uncharacterized protein YcfJ
MQYNHRKPTDTPVAIGATIVGAIFGAGVLSAPAGDGPSWVTAVIGAIAGGLSVLWCVTD